MSNISGVRGGFAIAQPAETRVRSSAVMGNHRVETGAAGGNAAPPRSKVTAFFEAVKSLFSRSAEPAPVKVSGPLAGSGPVALAAPGNASPGQKADAVARRVADMINQVEGLGSGHPAYAASKASLTLMGDAYEALATAPAGHTEMNEHIKDMTDIGSALDHAVGDMARFGSGDKSVADLTGMVKQLAGEIHADIDTRKSSLDTAMQNNPLSEKAVFKSKSYTTEGAIRMINGALNSLQNEPENGKARGILENAKAYLEDRHAQMLGKDGLAPLEKSDLQALVGSSSVDKGIKSDSAKGEIAALLAGADFTKNGAGPALPLSHPDIREDGMMTMFLTTVLDQAEVKQPTDMRSNLLAQRLASLNAQPWEKIEKEVVLQHGGVTLTLDSSITPQSQLGRTFEDMAGGGVNCHMARSYDHVTTLAVTSAKVGSQTLFEGIRHGTLTAYDISAEMLLKMPSDKLGEMVSDVMPKANWIKVDGEPNLDATVAKLQSSKSYRAEGAKLMRAEATYNRAVDVATAALVKNDNKLQAALDAARRDPPGDPVTVNISSVGLLTPDAMRAAIAGQKSKGSNEKLMLQDQLAAWDRLSADPQPKEITVKDPKTGEDVTVRVNVTATAFNFGVNQLAIAGMGPISPETDFISGWELADKRNAQSLSTFIGSPAERAEGIGGRVGDWLENAPRDTPEARRKVETVETLARQIGEIFDSGSHRSQGKEPYKIVSRLALLADMIGDDACWNCKSGKDRTGECDTEAKYLAAQIHMTGRVPEPDRERSAEEKSNFFRVAVDGGNQEIQALNSGAPGYKLGGVPSLADQMGTGEKDPHFGYFKGIAAFYGS